MRVVKFRAWIKSAKEMVTIEQVSDFTMVSNGSGFGIVDGRDDSEYSNGNWLKEDEFEVMQFTGLTDKNGKEIYEGDIVRWWNVYNEDGSQDRDMFTDRVVEIDPFFGVNGTIGSDSEDLEVIGNIYENKELLK